MALPKLNNTPYYDVTIPSTGVKTRYRPYLVKEEKVLLMAAESDDEAGISQAMLDVISSCVEGVDKFKLTTFDVQYLFLQLRSKSVGETSELLFSCQNEGCDHENKVTIGISDVNVDMSSTENNKIELSEDMTIELKYPTYYDVSTDKILNKIGNNGAEVLYQSVLLSLDALQLKDERMIFAEEPIEDVIEFIGSLSTIQFQKLSDYVNSIPALKKEIEYTCEKCKHKNDVTIEGQADFFL
jgi:hypothetical protein